MKTMSGMSINSQFLLSAVEGAWKPVNDVASAPESASQTKKNRPHFPLANLFTSANLRYISPIKEKLCYPPHQHD